MSETTSKGCGHPTVWTDGVCTDCKREAGIDTDAVAFPNAQPVIGRRRTKQGHEYRIVRADEIQAGDGIVRTGAVVESVEPGPVNTTLRYRRGGLGVLRSGRRVAVWRMPEAVA